MNAQSKVQEYSLSATEYRAVVKMIHEYAGIALADTKQQLVYGRLSRRLRALRLTSFTDYLQKVQDDPAERREFCNSLTTNLTSFFRENHHFEYLAKHALPDIERRNSTTQRIRIWSAGCSTGEEPYSIAMTVRETLGHLRNWDIKILATDLDSNVLAHGAAGIYGVDRFEKMSDQRRERWFYGARNADHFVARNELKELITFKQLNLIEQWPMKGPFDVIFCRNVIIYFEKETQRKVFANMAQRQRPGDLLLLGHSESLFNVSSDYQLIGQTIHKRLA